MGGIRIKLKQILIIAIFLTTILSLGCVSAADADVSDVDVISEAVTADVDTSAVDAVDVDKSIDAVETEPEDMSEPIINDSDSADLQDQDSCDDVTVVEDTVNSKKPLKANALGADDVGTFTELFTLFDNYNTVNLQQDYKWTNGDDRFYTLGKNIVIYGNGHTLDGSDVASLFVCYSARTITLNNLNLINFHAQANSNNQYGGVIRSQSYALTLTIDNCTFINNTAGTSTSTSTYRGGVVYAASGSTIKITHSVFVNNTASERGSVIYCAGTGTINATYNVFFNNTDTRLNRGCVIYFGSSPQTYDIHYNWWGANLWNDYVAMWGNYLPLTPHYYVAKMRQTSATTIELSLNSLQDGTSIPESERLPARPYLFTISPESATIRTPTGNISGVATSNFTIAGNGTITAYIDNEKIVLDIYQNTRGVIALNVTIENVVLPNKAVAIVNASFDDIYNVTVGDKTYQVNVQGGTGQVTLDELPAGTYLAMLSHIDNDEFHDAYNLTTFNVTKAQSSISLEANTTTPVYGSEVKVTPTVTPNDATGTIIYTLDGKNYAALEVGQDLIVTGLSAGEHRIVAKYGGNDEYEGSTSLELLINVQKATLTLSIVGDEVVYPESGKVTIESNVDGVYTVYVGETPYEARVSLGSGTFAVPTLDVATYTISVNVAESENYTAASATGTYKVTKTDPKFSIEGDNRIAYGETNTIHPTLNDDARGTITYYIDSDTEGTEVSYDGTFTTPATLDAGSHTIRAVYSGDTNYNSKEATFSFTITQAEVDITVVGDNVIYPNQATIAVTVNAANTYTITVNGKPYTRTIGKDETVEIELDTMDIGVYYVSVTAPATTNYKAVDIDKAATVIVNKPTLNLTVYNATITYGDTANVRITLKDGDTGLSMQGLMVAVGGTYYSVNIDDGEGTLPLTGLNAGTYNVVAICAYDENYDVAYATGKVTVSKAAPEITITAPAIDYGQDTQITVKLDGVNDEKLSGVVKVTINEKEYDVVVENGEGTLAISGLAANEAGYAIAATFAGNENYEAATYSGDAKQVVNKADATVIMLTELL